MLKEEIEIVEKINRVDGLDDINRGLSVEENLKIKDELQQTDINRENIMEEDIYKSENKDKQPKEKIEGIFEHIFLNFKLGIYIVLALLLLFLSKYL